LVRRLSRIPVFTDIQALGATERQAKTSWHHTESRVSAAQIQMYPTIQRKQ
jgi:hypothetical protein